MPAPTALRQPVDTPEIQATPAMGMLERKKKRGCKADSVSDETNAS